MSGLGSRQLLLQQSVRSSCGSQSAPAVLSGHFPENMADTTLGPSPAQTLESGTFDLRLRSVSEAGPGAVHYTSVKQVS